MDPIQNLESIDVIGKRHDGGVDLVIVVSEQLLDTDAHRELLGEKLNFYVEVLLSAEFQEEFHPKAVRIVVKCAVEPAPAMRTLIDKLSPRVREYGADLVLETP